MLKFRSMVVITALSLFLTSCTQVKKMQIPANKMSENQSLLTLKSSKLSSMLNIPFLASTVINVSIYERPERCKSPKELFSKQYLLGSARLTPGEAQQTVDIPSDKELIIKTTMERVVFFNIYRCTTALRFAPKVDTAYSLEITPPDVFEFLPRCHLKLLENTPQGPIIPERASPLNKMAGILGANLCSG